MSRLSLLIVAIACIICTVSAVNVTPFNDGQCQSASAVGMITGTPAGSCQALSLYGRSIKVTCSGGSTMYQEWSNTNCASSPSIQGSIGEQNPNTCIALTQAGSSTPSASVKIDCSSAAINAASSVLVMMLAFFAIKMQM